jgi:TIR domain-containing protein
MIAFGAVRRILEAAWERLFGPDIFITYTRRDGTAYTSALKKALTREYLVFVDDDAIKGGQIIEERIKQEIRRCRLHLVALTPCAVDESLAPWVFKEVEWCFQKRRTGGSAAMENRLRAHAARRRRRSVRASAPIRQCVACPREQREPLHSITSSVK